MCCLLDSLIFLLSQITSANFAVCCFLLRFAATDLIQVHLNEENYELIWPHENFTCGDTYWEIKIDDSMLLGLNVTVNQLVLNSDRDFYLALSPENDTMMTGTNASVVYMSGNLTNIKLAVPFVKYIYMKLAIQDPCKADENYFHLTLARLEKHVEIRPAPPPNPNPPGGFPTEIPVHFSNKTVSEFNNITAALQQRLKQLALNFCKENEINCDGTKRANETVFFRDVGSCPESWDDHEKCVKAWLAIFVTVDPKLYELTPEHLAKFWKHLEESPNIFGLLGIKPYEFPNISEQIMWWFLWVFIAVVIAGIIGFSLWRMEIMSNKSREIIVFEEEEKRKRDIFDGVTLRKRPPPKNLSKHQKIPDFMLSNGDASSVLTATSTPPITKKHVLRPILKQTPSEIEPIVVEATAETSSPTSPFAQNRPHWFMFNKAFEEEEEEVVFANESNIK